MYVNMNNQELSQIVFFMIPVISGLNNLQAILNH